MEVEPVNDTAGNPILSNPDHWYKILLDDGSEIGLGDAFPDSSGNTKNGRALLRVVPAGQGMVFRYQRFDGKEVKDQGWPQGEKGYLRGLQVNPDGSEVIKNMSLPGGGSLKLCVYNDNSNYGMVAMHTSDSRVALYAHNRYGTLCGLRVAPDRSIFAHSSKHALGLDIEFVKVSTSLFKGFF